MSLPVPAKTWQFSHITVPAGTTGLAELQHGLRVAIVGAFIGFGTGAATVAGSSNSLAAGMDAVNRWTTDVSLVWATSGNPHSWIVLNFGGKYFLLLDLNAFGAQQMSAYLSFAGFTGGSTTARPTATDEAQIGGVAVNTVPGWTHPIWGKINFASTLAGHGVYTNLFAFGGEGIFGVLGATPMNFGFTTEGASQALGQFETVVNDLDGGYPITSIGMYSNTVGKTGRHGQAEDIWWGSITPATGDSYPNDGSAQFMQIGNLVYPWDGTPLTIA
jgi:hypothetical protein